jgi:hypothetical protein
VTVLLVYVAVEAIVFVAYRPIVGASFGEVAEEAERLAPDVKPGREKAGLGFQDPNMSLHPYLGYVFTPKDEEAPEGQFRIPVSEDGFLDENPVLRHRGDGHFVVGLMGGSVSGQMGTFHGEHLRRALARHPDLAGKEIDFVWMGMPGYHQPQQVIQLGWVLAQGGELDLLINLDGFNEVAVPAALNAPQGAHPLFPMNWSMVALDTPDPEVRRLMGSIDYLEEERRRSAARFRDSFFSWSPTARLIWKRGDQRLEQRIAERAWRLQAIPADEVPYFVSGPARDHRPDAELIPACVDVWRRCSLQLQALCDAQGIRYLHCLQPNQYDPGSKPLSAGERESAWDAEGPYRPVIEAGYPLMREAGLELRGEGVAFHDLSDAFRSVKETLYVDSCCHFNGEGNRVLADAIGEAYLASF